MKRRRRRNYRTPASAETKHALLVILIWAGAVLCAVIIALAIGNSLKKSAAGIGDGVPTGNDCAYTYDSEDVAPVNARLLALEGLTDDAFAAAVRGLPDGTTAVSLVLRNADGLPCYRSSVSEAVTGRSGGYAGLPACVSVLKDKKIYVTGYLRVTSPSLPDGAARSAALDYEAALIAEAWSSGFDDIVISGLPADSDGVNATASLFLKVREMCPGAVLGAALDYKLYSTDDASYAVGSYDGFADFCAFDACSCSSDGIATADAVRGAKYYFLRYPLRVIIGEIGAGDREAQRLALVALGVTNLQSASVTSSTAAG